MNVLLVALAMDLTLGEPANRWHPVAWIGRLLGRGVRLAPQGPPWVLLLHGALLVLIGTAVAAAAAWLVAARVSGWPVLGLLVEAWLLKCTFSVRRLFGAVGEVQRALAGGRLEGARRALALHLVSRPTEDLDEGAAASAAVESLAENLTDSVVAPLCFFAVGGLPAAWAYRAVNTADAMIGYRDGRLEHLGKLAARLDDALNLLPARLAAAALVAGAWGAGESGRGAWRVWRRDGGLTASPNAGQTMAAMAGALGVTLAKRGHYRLGAGPAPDAAGIERALAVARWACGLCLAAAVLAVAILR
ncbi:MAG: cobalamin biosynthesis protein CobD [Candidatus Rokubacteria bacterium GWC2_70_16]|nr:MAG: cobalamin biosynthesis protein CobD [Candidatus Rokubacteria bacterium GWC2_70_16]OGL14674.1 MAG: cobalamin biosynthesis protein CobD [Candidatus Rokubacteria bacterium RIFCSPLOWO2_12_FULL_71_19]